MEAEAALARAELDRQRGRLDAALKGYDAAQASLASIGDPDLMWQIHYGRGLTCEARGDIRGAIKALTAAVLIFLGLMLLRWAVVLIAYFWGGTPLRI